MLDKETERQEIQELQAVDTAILTLIKYVHLMIDESINYESDMNQLYWWLYGELSAGIYPQVHQYLLALKQEWEVMYNGEESD